MSNGAAGRRTRERDLFVLLYIAPVLLLLLVRIGPLATGARTLYLRDVLGTHLEMKAAQAEAMRAGRLPLIDTHRAGGQPAIGNPDSVPLYPDNLLYLAAPVLWALNAHFWVHLLLAPFAMYWLGRAWGLRREAAWAAGTCYALGGYVLSHMMLYNQIAGVALAPALVAACLRFAEEEGRRWSGPAVAVLWALLLLGGEPFMAVLALVLAVGAVMVRRGLEARVMPRLALCLVCGTLIAAPQIVELWRIVGASYRGHLGYSPGARTAASWDPRQIVEWLVPFAFGRPDLLGAGGFWGQRFFTGHPPYYFSLYPGLLVLALAVSALTGGIRASLAPLAAVASGLFLALGRFNPAVAWLFESGRGLVRYPVRMWMPVALGTALLAGIGFERSILVHDPRARRGLHATLGALAASLLLGRLALAFDSGRIQAWLPSIMPPDIPSGSAAAAVSRWESLSLISIGLLAVLACASVLAWRRPREGGALLLAVHAGAQIALLTPLLATDRSGLYRTPPAIVEAIPPASLVAHGASEGLFGAGSPAPRHYPGGQGFWFARRAFLEGYPFAGVLAERTYELNVSSEGLDSFLGTAARDAVRLADDSSRIRLLAAWGVDYLVLDRPLDPSARDMVEPVLRVPSFGGTIDLYRIPSASPALLLAGTIVRAPTLNVAVEQLEDRSFDPRVAVVLPGSAFPAPEAKDVRRTAPHGGAGAVRLVEAGPEMLTAEVDATTPGVLVIQRDYLPLYRASVDGSPAPLRIANLHRIGVEVPEGRHRVDLWVDRRPVRLSFVLSVLGLGGLAVVAVSGRRSGESAIRRAARETAPA